MEIEVTFSRLGQCIASLQESEQQIKAITSEIELVRSQLRNSEDAALQLVEKNIAATSMQLKWKIRTIQTFYQVLEKVKQIYQKTEYSIEDGEIAWVVPIADIQVMPGFTSREWFDQVNSMIKMEG